MNNTPKNKILPNDPQPKSLKLSGKIVNPKRDWKILIIIFIVLIIAAVGFDFCMYKEIAGGDMYVSVNKYDIVVESLKIADLQKVLSDFQSKESKIQTLKKGNLVDPSI